MIKRLVLSAILLATLSTSWAQSETEAPAEKPKKNAIKASLGIDFVSSYIWRGQKNANPSFQPYASLGWRGLSLGVWGSFAVVPIEKYKGSQEEIDITLSYAWKGVHVGVTDYFTFENGHSFFKYGGIGECAHTFEANLGYDFGFLSVDWYTNFAGNDGVTRDSTRAFSSYIEIQAPFRLAKLDWVAAVGVVPYSTDFYSQDHARKFHCNNVSLRGEYAIPCGKKFKLPVFAQVIANPSNGDFYFLGGFTIKAL